MRWWRDAVVYQVYPRSFQDSDGDGIGDWRASRPGLDHLAGLGVDALWLSPIYPSPLADFGYDVADYEDVDPVYGTLEDFDRPGGRRPRARPAAADGPGARATRRSSTPGSASTRTATSGPTGDGPPEQLAGHLRRAGLDAATARRGRWYLHSFYPEQPDLDWRNPEVVRGHAGGDALLARPRRGRLPASTRSTGW